jgi:large subunit ribosomal protein L4
MELKVTDTQSTVIVSDKAFTCEFNETLVHQAMSTYMAGSHKGSKGLKTRSAVTGGGAKPWRQKGTGRARAGTLRSPLWRGGGVTFASGSSRAKKKLNKKMYRGAMRSIISELARQDRLIVLERFSVETPKTRDLRSSLNGFDFASLLIVIDDDDANLALASRNIFNIEVERLSRLNPVDLIRFDKVLMTVAILRRIDEWLS